MINSNFGTWQDRFYARTKKLENGCIEWTGATKWSGYGKLKVFKRAGELKQVKLEKLVVVPVKPIEEKPE